MSTGDQGRFREACRRFATGVTAVTGATPSGEIAALTVNSFTSVSLDPMQVLVCLAHRSPASPLLCASPRIAVHVLTDQQEDIARRLATTGLTGPDRLAGLAWTTGPAGEPLLTGAAARFSGPLVRRIDSGDHAIVVIEVDDVELGTPGDSALLFAGGRFMSMADMACGQVQSG